MLRSYLKLALKVLLRRRFFTFISLFGISFTLVVLVLLVALLDQTLTATAPEVNLKRTLHVNRAKVEGERFLISGSPGYRMLDRTLRDLPRVEAVSLYSPRNSVLSFVEGRKIISNLTRADGSYWRILQFRFLEGGPFTAEDERLANPVAVISAATRERFFDGQPALGRSIEAGGQSFRVVGVVADVPVYRMPARADIWAPISSDKSDDYRERWVGGFAALVLLTDAGFADEVKAELATRLEALKPDLPENFGEAHALALTRFESLSLGFSRGVPKEPPIRKMILVVVGTALAFMLLPAINLVNINISRIYERASEIGVRKAFGASSVHLVAQFLLENVVLCLIGGVVGFVASHGVIALIVTSGLLPWAQPEVNLRVFGAALLLAFLFGCLSGVYPAWRMARLHPVEALKGGGA